MKEFLLFLLAVAPFVLQSSDKQATPNLAISDVPPRAERKLLSISGSTDPTAFLDLVKPENQQNGVLTGETKRLVLFRRLDRWLTYLKSKLDRIAFVIPARFILLQDNLARQKRDKGFHPLVKFHRMYNELMNPITNPYLQMNMNNRLTASPEVQADPSFQAFQQQLHDYANSYANSLAEFKSGIFNDEQNTISTSTQPTLGLTNLNGLVSNQYTQGYNPGKPFGAATNTNI